MVDSRAKGAAGERQVRDVLRKYTKLEWQRVPHSGALSFMKGDLFVPNTHNNYCVEVKFYKHSHFNDKVLTNSTNQFISWWEQTTRQAKLAGGKPLLFFKYNRSKIFVATRDKPETVKKYMYVSHLDCYVMESTGWLTYEEHRFING